MEETAEEVLARLQRYVDTVRARDAAPLAANAQLASTGSPAANRAAPAPVGVTTATAPAPVAPTVVVERDAIADDIHFDVVEPEHPWSTLSRTVAGQGIAVGVCVVTLVAWMNLSRGVAYLVIGASAAAFGAGLARRVPFCGWCLIGVLVGLGLGRFS